VEDAIEWDTTPSTWPSKWNLSCDLILEKETMRVKFNKGVIVKIKAMNGYKVFVGTRNMKDIVQM
jgi:hypothetical protein